MIDWIVGMWAIGFIAMTSIWGLGFLSLWILWLVHEDSEFWSAVWIIILGVLAFQSVTLSWTTALIYAACYIPAGIAWSMYRWKRYCSTAVEDFKVSYAMESAHVTGIDTQEARNTRKDMAQDSLKHDLAPNNNITRFAHWIIAWPFSVVENVLGDVYDMVVKGIKKYLVGVYTRISDNAMKDL